MTLAMINRNENKISHNGGTVCAAASVSGSSCDHELETDQFKKWRTWMPESVQQPFHTEDIADLYVRGTAWLGKVGVPGNYVFHTRTHHTTRQQKHRMYVRCEI